MGNKIRFKIGEIEFEAEGSAEIIERERNIFMSTLLPSAVNAIVSTSGIVKSSQYENTIEQLSESHILPENNTCEIINDVTTVLPLNMDFTKTSLATFIKSKGADAHYDFILCAVYFNEKRNRITSFSSTTIKELYSEAKKPAPNNISMSLSELVKKGLIMEDPSAKGSNPKEYILTNEGEKFVDVMQPKEKKVQVKTRKVRPKEKSAYADINCDELNLQNYPEIKTLKSFKEKMMLALYIVTKEHKGEWFTAADVIVL